MACIVVEMYQEQCRASEQQQCLANAACPSRRMDLRCQPWSAR
jgi:hypothetical protein